MLHPYYLNSDRHKLKFKLVAIAVWLETSFGSILSLPSLGEHLSISGFY
ncbi:MAG: hypothetical protein RMX63_22135 [Aulosira sp. ZfuCHP01]|nr:hypothetical protein [Aulosira sp. ZfuCHP01]